MLSSICRNGGIPVCEPICCPRNGKYILPENADKRNSEIPGRVLTH